MLISVCVCNSESGWEFSMLKRSAFLPFDILHLDVYNKINVSLKHAGYYIFEMSSI